MRSRWPAGLVSVAATCLPLLLLGCADARTAPVLQLSAADVSASSVMYTVYPARSVLSSAAIVNGDLVTRHYSDGTSGVALIGIEKLWPTADVAKFEWAGNRIALLTRDGTLYGRDRRGEWAAIATQVVDFQLEGNRIGGMHTDGRLRVKDGLHGPWTVVAERIARFQLEGNRIGALQVPEAFFLPGYSDEDDDEGDDDEGDDDDDLVLGTLLLKEGIHGPWTAVATGVSVFQLEGNRVGALTHEHAVDDDDDDRQGRGGPSLLVKDGIGGAWNAIANRVSSFQLEGNRIGVLLRGNGDSKNDGDNGPHALLVRDGIHGVWNNVASKVKQFELEGNRIGVLHQNYSVQVKDGIQGAWTMLAAEARGLQLQEEAIGVLTDEGLLIRQGINGAWKALRTTFAGATQFRLLVDMPLVFRIRPPRYSTQAALCDAQYDEGEDADGYRKCYPTYATRSIGQFFVVGTYGRFCGAGVPADNGWANGQGEIDPVDAACREHDNASWYGIDAEDFKYHACVVRYAMEHSRLTVDGVAVEEDTPLWDAAWAHMPRTGDARDGWLTESRGAESCGPNCFEEFTYNTASKRGGPGDGQPNDSCVHVDLPFIEARITSR